MRDDLSHIETLDDLKREKFAIKQRIKMRKELLSRKMYEIPAEMAAAGVNTMIPSFLKGKVSNAAVNGGKKLLNSFIVPGDNTQKQLPGILKNVGLIRKVFSLFRK